MVKLAEALLRRKELQAKVKQLEALKVENVFVVRTSRKRAHEGIDDVIAQVPQVNMSQVTHAYDWHAKQLRIIDAAIQRANWDTEVDPGGAMQDYPDPGPLPGHGS